jgi:hypothetical protein
VICSCAAVCAQNFSARVVERCHDTAAAQSQALHVLLLCCRRCVTTWECLRPALLHSTWMMGRATSAGESICLQCNLKACAAYNITTHHKSAASYMIGCSSDSPNACACSLQACLALVYSTPPRCCCCCRRAVRQHSRRLSSKSVVMYSAAWVKSPTPNCILAAAAAAGRCASTVASCPATVL